LFGKYFIVAIDATGVVSFDEKHCEQCLHRTHENGHISYFHHVLEAKLVTPNGFCISLMTEWIENPLEEYNKQDCERKAFVRLAENLKNDYPHLPICLTADSLYPSESFFEICQNNDWRYILTFKEGTIQSIAEEAEALDKIDLHRRTDLRIEGQKRIDQVYRWVNSIDYQDYSIHWLECMESIQQINEDPCEENTSTTRFVHLTDFPINADNVITLSRSGRLRWKIENEGFNEQKNLGFAMSHKYSRVSYLAMKNYYQCLQIAHLFTQLMILNSRFQKLLIGKTTIKHLWVLMIGFLLYIRIKTKKLREQKTQKIQIRFVT
jgi:hypothetical protein